MWCATIPVLTDRQSLLHKAAWILRHGHLQIEALTADKRNLTKLLQQRDAEIDDLHKRHRQSLVSGAISGACTSPTSHHVSLKDP